MYISIDLGGTGTRLVAADSLDKPLQFGEPIRYENSGDYATDFAHMLQGVEKLAAGTPVAAIGLGTPGTPNADKTRIGSAHNLLQWEDQPLVGPLVERFGCRVFYANDAVAAGLGEAFYGTQASGNFHYLIWGTGIGGAEVSVDDAGNVSAEKLNWQQHFKKLEEACSGASLLRQYGKKPELFDEDIWRVVREDFTSLLQAYIIEFSPAALVFSGGLASKNADLLRSLNGTLGVPIYVSQFGNDSGLYGGFGLIKHGWHDLTFTAEDDK